MAGESTGPHHVAIELDRTAAAVAALRADLPLLERIGAAGDWLTRCIARGNTVWTMGNGGSNAEAMHLTQELTGRFRADRPSLRSVCLSGDPTALTCIANDYGWPYIFSHQMAQARMGDVVVAFSTSGQSANIVHGLKGAAERKLYTIALLGRDGGEAGRWAKHPLILPGDGTDVIQELHQLVLHAWLWQIEQSEPWKEWDRWTPDN